MLAKGGRVTIKTDTGKGNKSITDLKSLPSGRFEVLEIFLDLEKNPSAATTTLDSEMSALSGLKTLASFGRRWKTAGKKCSEHSWLTKRSSGLAM